MDGSVSVVVGLVEYMKASAGSFVSLLRECTRVRAMREGKQVHAHMAADGLEPDVLLANTLIDMYAKCGEVPVARQIFDRMLWRNVFSWTVMISAYREREAGEALGLFEQMRREGVAPNAVTYVGVLQACSNLADLDCGKHVHAILQKECFGLERDVFVGSTLVDMYAKCGSLGDSRRVFEEMPHRNVVAWSAMIAGYAHHGYLDTALALLHQMEMEGVNPNGVTFLSLLKACARFASLEQAREVHTCIKNHGFESELPVASALLHMYVKCGSMVDACQVWNGLLEPNVTLWNVMIEGYVENGNGSEALQFFERMQEEEGVEPNKATFISILKVCTGMANLAWGKEVHTFIKRTGLERDVAVGTTLVDMYGKCGSIADAYEVFAAMHERNVVSWSAMIGAYARNGYGKEALELFERMQEEGIELNEVALVNALKACAVSGSLEQGKLIHARIELHGFETNVILRNALIDMYAKCRSLENARRVFNETPSHSVVSWSAMIAACVENGCADEAFTLFEQMQWEGVKPNQVTYLATLKACISTVSLERGKRVHAQIREDGLTDNLILQNSLADMYAKCGSLEGARQVFNAMRVRNSVSWSVMIAGCVQHGGGEEALSLLKQMRQSEDPELDMVSFVGILKACATAGALDEGRRTHADIVKNGFETEAAIRNTLVYMYAKCGSLEDARRLFDGMLVRSVVSWSVMIAGYAHHGHCKEAIALYEQMQRQGVQPDGLTFTSVLSACSHSGLVREGRFFFKSMIQDYGITPTLHHYVSMVDLFSRRGHLREAEDFISKMEVCADVTIWMALLGACRVHNNAVVGRRAFEHIVNLEPLNRVAYVLLSNIYAAAGKWDEVANLRQEMIASSGVMEEEP